MAITLQDYLTSLQGKRVAVIGIGVSNTPLIKTLLQAGISVTACDKAPRTAFGALADEGFFFRSVPVKSSLSLAATERPPQPPSSPKC